MITGVVTSRREAIIRVLVRGPHGKEAQVEAVIDTGFTGFLTLPARLMTSLALFFAGTTRAALADDSEPPTPGDTPRPVAGRSVQ
jgi:predicted aspartyl protease